MYYVEWTPSVKTRAGRMVSTETLQFILQNYKDTGYRSVCMFSEQDANTIRGSKSSSGFSSYSVFSDTLFIDIDDKDAPEIGELRDKLLNDCVSYELYESGKKGCHFHIKIEPMYGVDVMYSQRLFVEQIYLGLPFDPSIYRNSSLIALPGRIHPDTGIPKTLVDSAEGNAIKIPLLVKPSPIITLPDVEEDEGELFSAFVRLSDALVNPPTPGNRHNTLWGISKALCDGGLDFNSSLAMIALVAKDWGKNDEEIERAVRQGFSIK